MGGLGVPHSAYVGKCAGCGAIQAATIDCPHRREAIAEDVAEMIRGDLIVEHVPMPPEGIKMQKCQCGERETEVMQ